MGNQGFTHDEMGRLRSLAWCLGVAEPPAKQLAYAHPFASTFGE
jgi:hypothetical protein